MPKISVVNSQGGEVSKVDLSPAVFDVKISTDCVRTAVNHQMARKRQGCASTKTRGLIRGGGAKPWAQKGTGNARAGSSRSPIWRGGGTTFGPTPRQYGGQINRKVVQKAILSCLTSYAREGELIIVDDIKFDAPKTKNAVALLKSLGVNANRVLFLTDETNLDLALSVRNLPKVDVINCDNLNTFDLTTHDVLILTSAAVKRIEEVYA